VRNGILALEVVVTVVTAAGSLAALSFTGLGARDTYVTSMSADGSVVVGVYGSNAPAFRWTPQTGVVNIGSVARTRRSLVTAKLSPGMPRGPEGVTYAALWQGGTTWKTLGGPPNGRIQGQYDDQ
jgi:hypothetical protein